MTDRELIATMEYCSTSKKRCGEKCPGYGRRSAFALSCGALDIINRQKAEIEKIKKDLKYYLESNEENGVVYIPKFAVAKMTD